MGSSRTKQRTERRTTNDPVSRHQRQRIKTTPEKNKKSSNRWTYKMYERTIDRLNNMGQRMRYDDEWTNKQKKKKIWMLRISFISLSGKVRAVKRLRVTSLNDRTNERTNEQANGRNAKCHYELHGIFLRPLGCGLFRLREVILPNVCNVVVERIVRIRR